jgi:inosose dehydratase
MDRRTFSRTLALGLAATSLPGWAQRSRNLKIGHTGITWPAGNPAPPRAGGGRPVDPDAIETVIRDISGLGYSGVELFGFQVDGMEDHGGVGRLLEKYHLPLIGTYGGPNLTDSAQRQDSLNRTLATAKLVKKYGGKVIVFGPNSVKREGYQFAEHKSNIVTALNEAAKAVADLGLTPVLHQHTGTCIETRDETYAVMEAIDTRYLKFGPDIGQLQKGGSDPVEVVKDFLPVVHHLHLKDYVGGEAFAGYCPLGQGKVDLVAILNMMDGRAMDGMIMVELDGGANMPMTALETARIAKAYLVKQGVSFRA